MARSLLRILCNIFIIIPILGAQCGGRTIIAVQPLGNINNEIIDEACKGIKSMYNADVLVLPVSELPEEAYYKPGKRYRAEGILTFLNKNTDKRITKIIGLTEKDISTTKGDIYDWGIFGLGGLGGRSCVVSTYRLRHGNASKKLFLTRFVKVVNHELGHTFGLDHCITERCVMEDAKGTIKTVDNENGLLCARCRKLISEFL